MNKTALVIPTLNAVQRGVWDEVLSSVAKQDIPNLLKIIVDSTSDDDTCSVASRYGWRIFKITRTKFNHGDTRNRICKILQGKIILEKRKIGCSVHPIFLRFFSKNY